MLRFSQVKELGFYFFPAGALLVAGFAGYAVGYLDHKEMAKEAARAVGQAIVPATFKERFEPDFPTLMAPSLYDLHPLWKEAPFGERLKGAEYQP
jgi:hypothetical protein